MDYLKEIKDFYRVTIFPHKGNPIGCSSEEIVALERQLGFLLPNAYKQFLLWMGKDVHGIFVGSNWFLDDVIPNTQGLKHFLLENQVAFELPAHYLTFFSHQGYMMAWFALPTENGDPEVYYYNECEMEKPRIEGIFTEFLLKDMTGMASFLPNQHSKNQDN